MVSSVVLMKLTAEMLLSLLMHKINLLTVAVPSNSINDQILNKKKRALILSPHLHIFFITFFIAKNYVVTCRLGS